LKKLLKIVLQSFDRAIIRNLSMIGKIISKDSTPRTHNNNLFIDCSDLYFTSINTGIQRVVKNIIQNIPANIDQKHLDIKQVVLMHGIFVEVDLSGFKHRQFECNKLLHIFKKLLKRLAFYGIILRNQIMPHEGDILLMLDASWTNHNVFESLEIAKNNNTKIIGVIYDLIPILYPEFVAQNLEKTFSEWLNKTVNYYDGYIAISKTVMMDLQSYFVTKNFNIDNYFFDYFYLGSNFKTIEKNQPTREDIRQLYSRGKSVYLIVSTIEPRKNHKYLFEAFKKLWNQNIDVDLVIVGRVGWKMKDLLARMEEHDEYQKRLWIFHDLNDQELEYCYNHSTALVFPSVVEGYGLPIIESLYHDLPVLASDTKIHREVGKEMIDYFEIKDLNSLVEKITNIENGQMRLKSVDKKFVKILTWQESASDLLRACMKG
jgi:alpha-1,2-rhamnosyltransferase